MIKLLKSVIVSGLAAVGVLAGDNEMETISPLYYVSTDKPIYRPGENVFIRAVVLDSVTNEPIVPKNLYEGTVVITDPRDGEVFSNAVTLQDSTLGTCWIIPQDISGGVYTVKVTDSRQHGASGERTFEIRAYRVPRIKTQIDFLKRGYFPGDTVTAFMDFSRAEGGIPQDATIQASVLVDGHVVETIDNVPYSKTEGRATVSFTLPEKISSEDGLLSFIIADGGTVETASKPLPILLENYEVAFYPEGGELIEGVQNRLYVQVLKNNGKGADIEGTIVAVGDDSISPVPFKTVHDGRGSVMFIPKADITYELRLASSGKAGEAAARTFALPAAKSGIALSATRFAYDFSAPMTFVVSASQDTTLKPGYIVLHRRSKEISRTKVEKLGEITLDADDNEGVLIATLYSDNDKPLAERLVFRRPKFKLYFDIKAESQAMVPGGKVSLEVTAKNEAGEPVEAVLGIQVTDESVLEMIEKREQAPRLPAMVYLENDVKDFADAAVYLDDSIPDAAEKLDLLLGTQGWRRWVLVDSSKIKAEYPELLKRILGAEIQLQPPSPMPVFQMMGRAAMPLMAEAVNGCDDFVEAASIEDEVFEKVVFEDASGMKKDNAVVLEASAGVADGIEVGLVEEKPENNAADEAFIMADMDAAPAMEFAAAKRKRRVPDRSFGVMFIREYAHQARPGRKPNDRVDFAETLYWNTAVRTSARTGKATCEFDLSDSVTSFRIAVDGFASNAAIGSANETISSVEPFFIEPKYPVTLSVGDTVELPIVLVNSTVDSLKQVNVVVEFNGKQCLLKAGQKLPEALAGGARERVLSSISAAGLVPGDYSLTIRGVAGNYSDSITRKITVVSKNFPLQATAGGRISDEKPLTFTVNVPDSVENGTQKGEFQVFTSPAATLEAALNSLLQHPHGCFEQTSSTNYPLVMAQQYFLSHSGINPEKITQANQLLEEGLKRLVSYECSEKGYEWFGENPGHEALTAYGLMQFADMAKVMPMDDKVVQDARIWLNKRRDGKGGFLRNEEALDSFGRADAPTTNLYITWAMLESGEKPESLKAEIEASLKIAAETKNMYLKALGANIAALAGQMAVSKQLCTELVANQEKNGAMKSVESSITCSMGDSLVIEGTSLAVLGWLRHEGVFVSATEKAMVWLAETCKEGRFGSTQSTILALKAINAYDRQFAKPLKAGSLQLLVDGKPFGAEVAFTENSTGILTMPDFGLKMLPGKHEITLKMTDGSELSAAASFNAMCTKPDSNGKLRLSTTLNQNAVKEGMPIQLDVTLKNDDDKDVNMPVAVVAIPGGATLIFPHLQDLVKSKRIAAYETKDNLLILYLRGLHAGQTADFPVMLQAEIPGTFTGAASYAYLYYLDEYKDYVPGLTVTVE